MRMSYAFSLNKAQYIIFAILVTTGLCASFFFSSVTLGCLVLLGYTLFFGWSFGKMVFTDEPAPWQLFFGSVALVSGIGTILTIIYWFWSFSFTAALALLVIIAAALTYHTTRSYTQCTLRIDYQMPIHWLHGVLFAGYGLLFWRLITRRFSDTLISPWTLFGPKFFILFFAITALALFLSAKKQYKAINLFFVVLHYALVLGVAYIIYKHGFGFDQYIHQSAEAVIRDTGSITPKQPYYIGQYMLALVGSHMTQLSLSAADALLVPLFSVLTVPLAAYYALRRRIALPQTALLLLPFLPLSFFTFTTPNNLALVFATLIVFWIVHEQQTSSMYTRFFGFTLSIFTCCIHPFVGIPALLMYSGSVLWQRISTTGKILYVILGIGALPFTLWANSMRLGQSVTLHNPLHRLEPFYRLFETPHWFIFDTAPAVWQAFYTYRLAIVPLFLVVAGAGFLFRRREHVSRLLACTTVALFGSAFFLSTSVEFPNVISYEQGVYGARLLTLCLICIFPFFLIGISRFLAHKKRMIALSVIGAMLLTASWYFTYPTRDPVSFHTGYAVRDADIEVVRFIHDRNKDRPHIVLTNQTVSAAAIKELGFFAYHETALGPQYAYSIPTGGPLYQYFRNMVYEEPKREWMVRAMDFVNVNRAYFVHTNYWAPAAAIRDAAKHEADAWWDMGNGRAWIYEYDR